MKKAFVFMVLCLFSLNIFAQETERGFYFDFGLGTSFGFGPKGINYNNALSTVKETASDAGYSAIPLYVDLAAGWAVLQNLYVVGTVYGMGDLMFGNSDFLMPGFRVYGTGVRFYPLNYLQIGTDIGLATTVFQASQSWDNVQTELGFGTKLSVAYDFGKDVKGSSFALGGAFLANILKDDVKTAFSIFAKYVYK